MLTKAQIVEWISHLRSGRFYQNPSWLKMHKNGPSHCGLGVLADAVLKIPHEYRDYEVYWFDFGKGWVDPGSLPCSLIPTNIQIQLIELNRTKDFLQIAEWIEKHLIPTASD